MAIHRKTSPRSLRARTVIGGALVSGALMVGAPAGMALATPSVAPHHTVTHSHNLNLGTVAGRTAFVTKVSSSKLGQAAFKIIDKDPAVAAAVTKAITHYELTGKL